jgi:hypothetical protein
MGEPGGSPMLKKELPPGGGSSFAESVSLSSTVPADFRLPATASGIGFGLLASRARRMRETRDRRGELQDPQIETFRN